MITLTIASSDRSNELIKSSLTGTDEINSRSDCSFKIVDRNSNGKPQVGEEVVVKDKNSNTIFGGTVDAGIQQRMFQGADILQWNVPCVDFHQLADKRVVAEVYENKTAGYIVKDLISNYLSVENITEGDIDSGPGLAKVVFNYRYASDCLDELSEITGYQWRVNSDKTLDFYTRDSFSAPWDLDDDADVYGITVEDNREDYRNKQYIRAGKDKTSLTQTNRFKGDGENQTFTCELPLAEEPSITINPSATNEVVFSSTEIGIRSVEENMKWYWAKEDKQVSQASSSTVLTAADTLKIEYTGLFPIVVAAQDDVAIKARKTLEGNSGLYEAVDQKAEIDDSDAAMELSEGKLRRYAELNEIITYRTETPGLQAGMIQTVNRTDHNISGDYLIRSVSYNAVGDGELEYNVNLISGEAVGGWVQFFKKLLQTGEDYVIRENEVLVRLKSFPDSVTLDDSSTQSSELYYIWEKTIDRPATKEIPSTSGFGNTESIGKFITLIFGSPTCSVIQNSSSTNAKNINFLEVV